MHLVLHMTKEIKTGAKTNEKIKLTTHIQFAKYVYMLLQRFFKANLIGWNIVLLYFDVSLTKYKLTLIDYYDMDYMYLFLNHLDIWIHTHTKFIYIHIFVYI